jgi:hypothetical protein
MAREAEGQYRSRLVTCHACAERSKAQQDLREGNADHGMHVAVTRIT